MRNIIFLKIIIFFFTTNILNANPTKIDGLKFYTLGDDNMPWFNLDNEKDLIDLSNIDCQWSDGKKKPNVECIYHPYITFLKTDY